jgi:Putative Actinobacterial Holin-X, holin superfamily III
MPKSGFPKGRNVPKGGTMDNDSIPPIVDDDDILNARGQIARLVSDVKSLAQAEWDYAKARLSYSGGVARKAGFYALMAILALSSATIALVLGILLIINSYWGPWIATASVVLVFGLAAFVFAIAARNTARSLTFAEVDHNDE